jgi:hypothetical protein
MKFFEKFFAPKPAPEKTKEQQVTEKVKRVLALEQRIREVQENVAMFGSAPADHSLLTNLHEQIETLNKEIVALGGSPVQQAKEKMPWGNQEPKPATREEEFQDDETRGEEQPA